MKGAAGVGADACKGLPAEREKSSDHGASVATDPVRASRACKSNLARLDVNGESARPVTKQGNVFGEKGDHDLDEHASGAVVLLGNTLIDIHDFCEASNDFFGELSLLEDDLRPSEALFGEARLAHDDGQFSDEELLRHVVRSGSVLHEPLEHRVAVVRAGPSAGVPGVPRMRRANRACFSHSTLPMM